MKIKVVANELVDTDIEMVSLVRHGANRIPFRVLKSDDEGIMDKLGDKLSSMLSLGRGNAQVVAYFVDKTHAERLLPKLADCGVNISKAEERDGLMLVAVDDLPMKGCIQLNDYVAVAIDQPLREFEDDSIVKTYAESVGMHDFAPGVRMSVTSLAGVVWSLLNKSDEELGERVEKVDVMLAAFRKYITTLAKMLPEQIFKVEEATAGFRKEEDTMARKPNLNEAVAGDLDGLTAPVSKSDAATATTTSAALPQSGTATVTDGTPATTDTVVAKAHAPCEGCPNPESCAGEFAKATDMSAEDVEKACKKKKKDAMAKDDEGAAAADAGAAAPAGDPRIDALFKAVTDLTATVGTLVASVTKTQEAHAELVTKLGDVEKVAKTAQDTAASTTVVRADSGDEFALSSLGGRGARQSRHQISKGHLGDSLWDGLFDDLDTFRGSR